MKSIILSKKGSLSFSDYFKLNYKIDEIIRAHHYLYRTDEIRFNSQSRSPDEVKNLKKRLQLNLKNISIDSEIARREFLIAPVLEELLQIHPVKIKVEYYLELNEQLKGNIDYYIEDNQVILIIEAKNADMQKGFTQLAVEMIAVDQCLDDDAKRIFAAVTTGDVWKFGILDRQKKEVTQDINLYRVPADIEELLGILIHILTI